MSFVVTLWFLVFFVFQQRRPRTQTDPGSHRKQSDHDIAMEPRL